MDNLTEEAKSRTAKRGTPSKASAPRRTRRRRGDGAVIRRGDGRWAGRIKQPDGRVRWYYGKDQQAVEDRLAEALRLLKSGVPLRDATLTFGSWLIEWLDGLSVTGARTKGLKPATIAYYRQYVEAHVLRSELAAKPLAKLAASDLVRLYHRMTAQPAAGGLGLSSTTAHHLHAVVHRALAQAVRQGKVARNVAELVAEDSRPSINRTEMHLLADENYDRFLEAVRGHRLEALFVVAIREGLRQGELLALRWCDVDLDNGTLAITGSLQATLRSGLTIGDPTSRKARRSVTLFPGTIAALREHRAHQLSERRRAGSRWADRDLVFCTEIGGFLRRGPLTRMLDTVLRGAGLPDVRFQDLRHSAATDWLAHGMHPKVAAERLGHASVGIMHIPMIPDTGSD